MVAEDNSADEKIGVQKTLSDWQKVLLENAKDLDALIVVYHLSTATEVDHVMISVPDSKLLMSLAGSFLLGFLNQVQPEHRGPAIASLLARLINRLQAQNAGAAARAVLNALKTVANLAGGKSAGGIVLPGGGVKLGGN